MKKLGTTREKGKPRITKKKKKSKELAAPENLTQKGEKKISEEARKCKGKTPRALSTAKKKKRGEQGSLPNEGSARTGRTNT